MWRGRGRVLAFRIKHRRPDDLDGTRAHPWGSSSSPKTPIQGPSVARLYIGLAHPWPATTVESEAGLAVDSSRSQLDDDHLIQIVAKLVDNELNSIQISSEFSRREAPE